MSLKKIMAATCTLVLAISLASCSEGKSDSPVGVVEDFTDAISAQDMDAALDCCDEATCSVIEATFGFADGVMSAAGLDMGIGARDIVSFLFANATSLNELIGDGEWDLSVEAKDLSEQIIDESHATVTGIWTMTSVAGGKSSSSEGPVEFSLVKEDGEWRITFADEIFSAFAG